MHETCIIILMLHILGFHGLAEFKMLHSYVNMYLKFFIVWPLHVSLEKEMEKVTMKEKDAIWHTFVKKKRLIITANAYPPPLHSFTQN